MADAKDSGSSLPTSGIVLLLVMATGTIFLTHDLPLQGSRPPSAERQIHDTYAAKDVEARLWQDPLAAVRKSWAEEKKREAAAGSSRRDCSSSPHRCPPIGQDEKIRVIGVTVPGAPYAEDAESRRRYRYAVLAALEVQEYVPEDGEHIGYFVPAQLGDTPQEGTLPETVPFERFDPAEPSSKRPPIVILWIDEDALTLTKAPKPIASLKRLYERLTSSPANEVAAAEADLAATAVSFSGSTQPPNAAPSLHDAAPSGGMTIIGPSSSKMLGAMIKEMTETPPSCADGGCPREFFDFGATVSDENAFPPAKGAEAKSVEGYFHETGLIFHRMVAPDDVLARTLADELRLRGLCLGEKECTSQSSPGHVAMVSEWDTLYGQSLRRTINRALCPSGSAEACASKLEQYSYLRGLDGQLPNDGSSDEAKPAERGKASGEQTNNKKDDDTSNDTAKRLERPDGLGQFDYLRRLASSMKQRDQELRRRGDGGIMAVGVLGSDVYDKLLVLRALRREFPEALFFTTDLDARFSDQGEIAATRNLLVVSGFDLQLRQEIQRDIPPFRDGYQTAAFLSTQAAISGGERGCANCDKRSWTETARIFQIGRTGAFAFPTHDKNMPSDGSDRACGEGPLGCANIHAPSSLYPTMSTQWLPRTVAALLVGLLLAGATLGSMVFVSGVDQTTTSAGRAATPRRSVRGIVAVAAFAIGVGLSAHWNEIADWLTRYGSGEPMLLSDGISVWPSIAIRMLSFAVCVMLIVYSLNHLDANIDAIASELQIAHLRNGIIEEQRKADRLRSWWARLRDIFSMRPQERPPHGRERDQPYEIVKFWRTYVYRGRKAARALRATLCVAVMIGFAFVLSLVFGAPNDPSRDVATHRVYVAITTLDVIATQFLIFLVADATLFSCLFVRELRQVRSVWPKGSREAFRALVGVDGLPLDEWIDTQFVAKRTQCIINLIYLPFIMIALLIVSRSSAFDSFAASPTLILIHGVSLAVVAGCILWLRREAERARTTARSKLTSALITMRGNSPASKGSKHRESVEALEKLITRVETLQEGAFAPITRQPVVRALLLPLGTYGGTAFFEHVSLGGSWTGF